MPRLSGAPRRLLADQLRARGETTREVADRLHRRRVPNQVHNRQPFAVGAQDVRIVGNDHHLAAGKRGLDALDVIRMANLVRDDQQRPDLALGDDLAGPAAHLDGSRRWLGHQQRQVDRARLHARQIAHTSLHVGDDGGVLAGLELPEQLLG